MSSDSRAPATLRLWLPSLALASALACPAAADPPPNQPFDSNGNGTLDSVIVAGDYDGDGHSEPEDVQAAILDLRQRLPGEPGSVRVRAGRYVEVCRAAGDPAGYCWGDPTLACDPAAGNADCAAAGLAAVAAACRPISCQGWATRPYAGTGLPRATDAGLIDIGPEDGPLTLECDPGTILQSIPNKRRFDGVPPSPGGGDLGSVDARPLAIRQAHDVSVVGCHVEGGIARGVGAYDPVQQDWPLVADGGHPTALLDAAGGWRDDEWNLWWVLLRPGCLGPGDPYAWCSAAEEASRIVDTYDAFDVLAVQGFTNPPRAGDRYLILYRDGGVCSGDPATLCTADGQCGAGTGPCDLSVDDDLKPRMTVAVIQSENVVLRNLQISGSSHAGLYVKSSRNVQLLDSELFENGGYYSLGRHFPSSYWFSGLPGFPCFGGDVDCRLRGALIEGNEIHHGSLGVTTRWQAAPGQEMYVEDLEVRGNHIHDLFSADGAGHLGINCKAHGARCEENRIERALRGIEVIGVTEHGWPSEQPPVGSQRNSWDVTLRANTLTDLWQANPNDGTGVTGIGVGPGVEGVQILDNHIERVAQQGAPVPSGDGIRVVGPNRGLVLRGNSILDTRGSTLKLLGEDGIGPQAGDWLLWPELETDGEDLGIDPATHLGAAAGFLAAEALGLVEIDAGGRLRLRDAVDSGHRGGAGGEAEALYVRDLIFSSSEGQLNLDGNHLYVDAWTGGDQVIDLAVECGNGTLEVPEECDDGGLVNGDGCTNRCEVEEELRLWGVAAGGQVGIVVDGVAVQVTTLPGQTNQEVVASLAAALLAEPALADTTILALYHRLVTSGHIESVELADAGLSDAPPIPALGLGGLALTGAALLLAGWWTRRR